MQVYFLVGIGGAVGSILRYLFSLVTLHMFRGEFPIGTILVNLLGAFFLGWFTNGLLSKRLDPKWVTAITTGVIGSFTTLSTLSVDLVTLLTNGKFISAFLYLMVSIIGGLGLAYLGLRLGTKQKAGE